MEMMRMSEELVKHLVYKKQVKFKLCATAQYNSIKKSNKKLHEKPQVFLSLGS
jgi:hypothetical protein